jgi:hypothetical protein
MRIPHQSRGAIADPGMIAAIAPQRKELPSAG